MDSPSELAFIPVHPPKKVLESVVTTDSTIESGVADDPGSAWRRTTVTLQIRTAADLMDPELEARWNTRRAARETEILQAILRMFVERPDPIVVEEFIRAFPKRAPDETRAALRSLDEDDLIQIRDGRVDLAYPFSTMPMPFVVHLSGRGDRYVCCAIDALGVAPMLGESVRIRSRCHHCGESLEFSADPFGPGPDAEGVMMWAGKRCAGEQRASTST
jgi:hypothetical protein